MDSDKSVGVGGPVEGTFPCVGGGEISGGLSRHGGEGGCHCLI